MTLEEKFDEVYCPLMDEFVNKLLTRNISDYQGIPHPFVPIWGKNYEKAFKRIAIVGKETRGWGISLDDFLGKYKSGQYRFEQDRCKFRNFEFRGWGANAYGSFWGFGMRILANVYGVENWHELKKGERNYLLDDFVWGNCLSIQNKWSDRTNASAKGYDCAFNAAQECLNSIDYLEKVFAPDVVILTYKNCRAFLGNGWECVADGRVKVLRRGKLVVFLCYHPHYLGCHGMIEEYAGILSGLLQKYGFSLQGIKNKFISQVDKEALVERIKKENDKYKAVEVIALTLRKYGCIMTARDLSDLLNKAGYLTNHGNLFTGNSQGPYKIISAAYNRAKFVDLDTADAIASSFTRADGSYAYK
jgi:hypothetical protein